MNGNKYYKSMLAIAIPVSIQSLFQAALSVIDQIMVGHLGENSIAAVGLGSRLPFIFLVSLAAIGSTTSIMISQFWSKKDNKNISRSIGGNLIFGIILTILFGTISLFLSINVLTFYSSDSKVIHLGAGYLKIIAVGYIPMLIITIYAAVLRSTEKVKATMYAGILAILMNTALNYVLIFGKLGFPELGFYGTAYATTITRFVEAALLIFATYYKKMPGMYKLNEMFAFSEVFLKQIILIAAPLMINEFLWALGDSMYSMVYGRMGTNEVAAMTLTYPMQSLSIGLFAGVSSAAGIMIGNKLGSNENALAYEYSKKYVKLGFIGSIIFGGCMVLIAKIYMLLFNVSAELKNTTIKILIVFGLVLFIKVTNMILGGGILRSGGKTKYTLYLDILGTWVIGVPLGFVGAFVLKLPIVWVYLLINVEELVRLIIGLKIMVSKKWMKNITEEQNTILS
jgi:putative MATE family efflux protein